jgi:cellulose synthase/poly-beta-1,6-N-acetylglucosamine synthase-like glycosyltransferase
MKISFIIPAYNEEKRLPKCLESIQKELATGHYDAEIIVANNVSTDRTKEVALTFPDVKVVDEQHKGIVWARRAGFLASSGDLIANVDADTMLPSGWLATVFTEFEKHPDLLALSGPFIYYDLPLYHRIFTKIFYFLAYILNYINHIFLGTASMLQGGNFILRRSALEKIGGYDTSIEFYGEDSDIGRRVSKIGKVKWTFALPMYTSGRRLAKEGIVTTGIRYAVNHIWITFTKKPFSQDYNDIRPEDGIKK